MRHSKTKSVQSFNLWQSVIQTKNDIVNAHGGELKVETLPAGRPGKEGEGSEFIVSLPVN